MAGEIGPQPGHQVLGHLKDVLAGDEAHLDVDLGELRLPVGAEVLVPETAGELVVAFQAADHQQLLEQLRGLRQRVPGARAQPDGDHEVPGSLRRGSGQVRGFHVDETVLPHDVAGQVGRLRAEAQGSGRLGPPDVQVAVPQPDILAQLARALDGERQGAGLGQDLQAGRDHLNLPGRELRVLIALGPLAHLAGDPDAELGAQGVLGTVLALTAEHHLHHTARVAQVDEDHPAVVAAPRHPARQGDLFPGLGTAQRACPVGSNHRVILRHHSPGPRGPVAGISPARNGFPARSAPMVVCGPWPGSTRVSSGSVRHTRARLSSIAG